MWTTIKAMLFLHMAMTAVALNSAAQLRGSYSLSEDENVDTAGTYWMELTNMGDVQYTGLMRVGGQQVKAIVDTGSFELLVFGANCTMCGSVENLYNGSKSSEYFNTGFAGTHSFGSGTCYSKEVRDKVQLGSMKIPIQVFWEVTDADMPILSEDSFQAILGVGPPSSIVKFAEDEALEVHKELKEFESSGNKVTKKVKRIVEHYDEQVVHAQNLTTVAENVAVENMAVCLNKKSGSNGYYIWNDKRVVEKSQKFVELEVTGDVYWSVNMTDVKLGRASDLFDEDLSNATKAVRKAVKQQKLGCSDINCSAVIDTGTSLIVAPTKMAEKVFKDMQEWIEAGGTCEDLSKLPDLKFQLNGIDFSLPPEAYVGTMEGEMSSDMKRFMPHLYSEHKRLYETVGCQPLIMTMDAESQYGPLWILGMPFFRKYYTNFKFVKHMGKLSLPLAKTMSFSVADKKCRPGRSPLDEETVNLLERRSDAREVQLKVDARRLRVSQLAQKVQAQLGENLVATPGVRI